MKKVEILSIQSSDALTHLILVRQLVK